MKKNIREDILRIAPKLFNERGYHNVTMRDIAGELGIGIGNLTYYYNKKEQLLEAVVLSIYESYETSPVPTNLKELSDYFILIADYHREDAFFFMNYTQLSQLSDRVFAAQLKIMIDHYKLLSGAFDALCRQGHMREEALPGHHRVLAETIITLGINWLPQSSLMLELEKTVGEPPRAYLQYVWKLLYPELTEAGKQELLVLNII